MPSLFFQFDKKWIEVVPKNYVKDTVGDNVTCTLFISAIDEPTNVLGLPLMMDYYTMFDAEKGTIQFAPHSSSTKVDIVEAAEAVPAASARMLSLDVKSPVNAEKNDFNTLFWIDTSIYYGLVIAFFYIFVYS